MWATPTRTSGQLQTQQLQQLEQLRANLIQTPGQAAVTVVGHPIIGDGKYGGSGQENLGDGWGAQLGGMISRKLHLHARFIQFEHPTFKKTVSFSADLPSHMIESWKHFQWHLEDVPDDPFNSEEDIW